VSWSSSAARWIDPGSTSAGTRSAGSQARDFFILLRQALLLAVYHPL